MKYDNIISEIYNAKELSSCKSKQNISVDNIIQKIAFIRHNQPKLLKPFVLLRLTDISAKWRHYHDAIFDNCNLYTISDSNITYKIICELEALFYFMSYVSDDSLKEKTIMLLNDIEAMLNIINPSDKINEGEKELLKDIYGMLQAINYSYIIFFDTHRKYVQPKKVIKHISKYKKIINDFDLDKKDNCKKLLELKTPVI